MSNWHHHRLRCIRYVGSKIRIVPWISEHLHSTGAGAIVDVFGGSGAVVMNAGFSKRVYNDLDDDLVHFFRTLAAPAQRPKLIRYLRSLPMSRSIFRKWLDVYAARGRSFAGVEDPIERAAAIFYLSSFCYGGKIKNGGFAASLSDANQCKEISRYRSVLRQLADVGQFWRGTVIENLHFSECITAYCRRPGVILYCDPPYMGTEYYYSTAFSKADHVFLAEQLSSAPCRVAVSYYDHPTIRELYRPEDGWRYHEKSTVKNSQGKARNRAPKQQVTELLLVKPAA